MSNLSHIDADKIRSTAQKLADIDIDILNCMEKLAETMDTLDKGWVSEVKASFMQTWEVDAEALCEMMDQYNEVQEMLLEAAQDFDNTENEMAAKVSGMR